MTNKPKYQLQPIVSIGPSPPPPFSLQKKAKKRDYKTKSNKSLAK